MFTPDEIVDVLRQAGVSHVVWVPDSTFGPWEDALESAPGLSLVRVCREGEAWPLAAGLFLGGKAPLILMQSTGFFESGDAMRNILFDLEVPLCAVVGARNWLTPGSRDTARRYLEPVLRGWDIDYRVLARPEDKGELAESYRACRDAGRAGIVVLAEGRG